MVSLSLLLLAAPADDAAIRPLRRRSIVWRWTPPSAAWSRTCCCQFSSDERFAAVISGQDLSNLLSLEQQKMAMGCDQTSCLSGSAPRLTSDTCSPLSSAPSADRSR